MRSISLAKYYLYISSSKFPDGTSDEIFLRDIEASSRAAFSAARGFFRSIDTQLLLSICVPICNVLVPSEIL